MNDIQGFMVSEAAIYAFECQDVYPDIISFVAAIPDHLRPLFLIPVQFNTASHEMAVRIADDIQPTGLTDTADLFSYNTFNYGDNDDTFDYDPGSIFDITDSSTRDHHQEFQQDENIQVPSDTSYMSDVDITQYFDYPYRTNEKPIRHSFKNQFGSAKRNSAMTKRVILAKIHIALNPEDLQSRVDDKIKKNAQTCSVKLDSYDKKTKVFTFSVNCGNGSKTVQAALSDEDHISLSCNCKFWQWNGPEFHAQENSYILGQPYGTASPPDVRDPDRKQWLCKHAYSVLRRFEEFVSQLISEMDDDSNESVTDVIEDEWDRMEGATEIPLEELEEEDVDVDWGAEEDFERTENLEEEEESEVEEPEVEEPEVEEPEESEEPEEEESEEESSKK